MPVFLFPAAPTGHVVNVELRRLLYIVGSKLRCTVLEDLQSTSRHLRRKVFPSAQCPYQALFSINAFGRINEPSLSVHVQSHGLRVFNVSSRSYSPTAHEKEAKAQAATRQVFLVFWFSKSAGPCLTLHMIFYFAIPSHCLTTTDCTPEAVILSRFR